VGEYEDERLRESPSGLGYHEITGRPDGSSCFSHILAAHVRDNIYTYQGYNS